MVVETQRRLKFEGFYSCTDILRDSNDGKRVH